MSSNHHSDQGPSGHHQYSNLEVYFGLSTASEVFHFSLPTIYTISALKLQQCTIIDGWEYGNRQPYSPFVDSVGQ